MDDDWKEVRIDRLFVQRGESARREDPKVTAFIDGVVTLRSNRPKHIIKDSGKEIGYKHVEPGDLVISGMNAHLGAMGISDSRGKCTPVYTVLRPIATVDQRFISYALRSAASTGYVKSLVNAVRYNSSDFTPETLKRLFVPLPPLEVQRRIADFLDDQVARIDRAIQLRQRQAELMTHRHLTAVSEAVDQLGAFHGWVPLRRFVVGIEQGWSPQCDAFPASDSEWGVVKVGAVRSGRFRAGENKRLPEGLSPEVLYEIHAGDLLITRANTPELVGDVCVVPRGVRSRLILCDKIMRVRVDARVSPEFVAIVAQSRRSRMHFSALASGASQSMVNIRGEDVREMAIPLTPEVGQQALIRSTTESREFLDTLRQGIQASMALLSERRRSLITAAVTGEFDVSAASSWAADAVVGRVGE